GRVRRRRGRGGVRLFGFVAVRLHPSGSRCPTGSTSGPLRGVHGRGRAGPGVGGHVAGARDAPDRPQRQRRHPPAPPRPPRRKPPGPTPYFCPPKRGWVLGGALALRAARGVWSPRKLAGASCRGAECCDVPVGCGGSPPTPPTTTEAGRSAPPARTRAYN